MAKAGTLNRSSWGFLSESPATIEAFPLADKPLSYTIPGAVKIDKTATFVASIRPSTQQVLHGLPLFNRFSFPLKDLGKIDDLDLHLSFHPTKATKR